MPLFRPGKLAGALRQSSGCYKQFKMRLQRLLFSGSGIGTELQLTEENKLDSLGLYRVERLRNATNNAKTDNFIQISYKVSCKYLLRLKTYN